MSVEGAGGNRRIKVELRQRRMQSHPERFVSVLNSHGFDVFASEILVPEEVDLPILDHSDAGPEIASDLSLNEAGDESVAHDAEAAMGEEDTRDLLYRFWNLSSSQRREITTALGLLEGGEMKLPEPERYGRALIRAAERKIMDKVAAEVAKLES